MNTLSSGGSVTFKGGRGYNLKYLMTKNYIIFQLKSVHALYAPLIIIFILKKKILSEAIKIMLDMKR